MPKKGQVTIFIILGIVLLVVLGLIFFLYASFSQSEITKLNSEDVQNLMDSCLKENLDFTLFFIGLQGGYFSVNQPSNFIELGTVAFNNPFYYYLGENTMPEITEIEENIKRFIEESSPDCLAGLGVETGTPQASVKIDSDIVIVDLEYPIKISKADSEEIISSFSIIKDMSLKKIHDVSSIIVDELIKSDKTLNLLFLQRLANENNLDIEYYVNSRNLIEFYIMDNSVTVLNSPYIFIFSAGLRGHK